MIQHELSEGLVSRYLHIRLYHSVIEVCGLADWVHRIETTLIVVLDINHLSI